MSLMDLIKKLLNTKPREESGSKTARKFTFQQDLSLYLLLKMHDSKEDYVFLFDFHDDLMILNSSEKPQKIAFYQIKSKDSGNWTIHSLTKRKSDETLSILGKLYNNKIDFPNHTESLNFISNARYSMKELRNGENSISRDKIKVNELLEDIIKSCKDSIKEEHGIKDEIDLENYTVFHVTNLSNKDSSTHCIGALSNFVNKLNPANQINPELAYKQIINEVSRKTKNTFSENTFDNYKDLVQKKGITKKEFLGFLEIAGIYKGVDEEWRSIELALTTGGIGQLELQKFKTGWRQLSITLIKDADKIHIEEIADEIKHIIENQYNSGKINDNSNLLQIINTCYPSLKSGIYDEYVVKCFIIKVINEK